MAGDAVVRVRRGRGRPVGWWQLRWPRLITRLVAGLAILMVAVVMGRVSYLHIFALTVALHQPVGVARLMPFGVDGMIVVGSIVQLTSAGWLGWLGIGPGIAISLFANVESGVGHGWLAATWAGVPAVTFALSAFLFERWLAAQAAGTDVACGSSDRDRAGVREKTVREVERTTREGIWRRWLRPGPQAAETPGPGVYETHRASAAVPPGPVGPIGTPAPLPRPAAEPGPSAVPVPAAPVAAPAARAVPRATKQQGQQNRDAVRRFLETHPADWRDLSHRDIAEGAGLGSSKAAAKAAGRALAALNGSKP